MFIEAPKTPAVASSGYPTGDSSQDTNSKKNAAPPQIQSRQAPDAAENAAAEQREKAVPPAADKSITFDDASEAFEDDDSPRTPPKRRSAQDSEGGQDYDEEKDPYSDVFDADGPTPASPGLSQGAGAYSQDEFDFDYDRSPAPDKASPVFEKQQSQIYSEADCTEGDEFEAENDCTQGEDEFEDDDDRTPPNTAGTKAEDAAEGEFEADFEQADEEPGDDEFENEASLSPKFEAAETSNQPNPADVGESRARSESNEDEFEDEATALAHQVSKYDTSDCFEDEANSPAATRQKSYGSDGAFEDDEYGDGFED